MNSRTILVKFPSGKQKIYKDVKEVKTFDCEIGAIGIFTDYAIYPLSKGCKLYERAYKKGWRELEL